MRTPTAAGTGTSAYLPSCQGRFLTVTTIQAEPSPEPKAIGLGFVEKEWASDFNELPTKPLRSPLESHSPRPTESMVMSDSPRALRAVVQDAES
jgi:hypothetical protein